MQNTPHQAQKAIFTKFEQCGMGLGMFWWSNRPWELKPHLWNIEDLWNEIRHFLYWKLPHSYYIVLILAKKTVSIMGT